MNIISNNDAVKNMTRVIPLADIYLDRMNAELEQWREKDRGYARIVNPARLMMIDTESGNQGEML